jgi:periplasmic divalent cation tolerance protein
MPFKLLYITCPNETEGREIARYLVEKKLAACVNIIPGVQSFYGWEGNVADAKEVLLLCKTLSQNIPAIVDAVKQLSSYDLPAISAIPIFGGNPDYLAWIAKESPGNDFESVPHKES